MRTIHLGLAACFAIVLCLAQQQDARQSTAAELLSRLRSDNETVRGEALWQLRSDPAMLHLPLVRSTLFDMLDQNNRETAQAMRVMEERERTHPTESGDDGEDGDEFFSWLVETAASVADWSDPRQVCILVDSSSDLDGRTPEETTAHVRAALPCILRRSHSDVNIFRAMAAEMLVKALAKGKRGLDAQTIKQAQGIILSNLRDPNAGVRSFTVGGLYEAGEPDMIPALAEVARLDPAIETNPDKSQWYPIRDFAAKAIKQIQERSVERK